MKRRLLAGLVPVALLFSGSVQADIYAFVDQNGIRHLSNVPNDSRYKLVMRTPTYRTPSPPSSSFAPSNLYSSSPYRSSRSWGSQPYYSQKPAPRRGRVNEQNRQRFSADVERIATQYRLEPALMHAVISAESSYNPWAVSPKGAMGLMQLMPGTASRFGVGNPYDPIANMHGGARYLRWLLDYFNDTRLAVAAYNAGEGAVKKYGNQIPPYRETQTYVGRVLGFYQQYKGSGGFYPATYSTVAISNPRVYGSGYTGGNNRNAGGVTIINPRSGSSRSTGSATIPSTYLTPTGTRIIVGNSSGSSRRVASTTRSPIAYTINPNRPTSSASARNALPLFVENDR